MSVFEIYIEKKSDYAAEAALIASELRLALQIDKIKKVRILIRYFTEGILTDDFLAARNTIFSQPPLDIVYDTLPSLNEPNMKVNVFAVEFLPGQFDQRADSCAQCISLASGKEKPIVQTAKIYAVYGDIDDDELSRIKSWLINPVESRETSLEKPSSLIQNFTVPEDIKVIEGFIKFSNDSLSDLLSSMNLAMDIQDLIFCRDYFLNEEKRDPTITEIRLLDTYWSDHCRHTTFLTELNEVIINDDSIQESYNKYLELRSFLNREDKPVTLMDMATIAAKVLKQRGLLQDLDESDEINACSVKIKVDVDNQEQDWLLMFKNETHNHPTEIEPFGGASTCLGGAIRDPLSGRAYVYQAMRITGAANPLQNVSDTLPGKLPQLKICRTAAAGYSSYGNQIGTASGLVNEIYHPGYAAKRMELGAVIGAAPAENVIRKTPSAGDVIILLGGRTGRDGIGAAAGSSKSHTSTSLDTCAADVQKGNAPEERKLLRLFRNPDAAKLIKKCNDFGAGGVSVSVGELADGLLIDLDKVPVKYDGLDGTEIAISESQERMSVVIDKKNETAFIDLAEKENLEATVIASVTDIPRLVMKWRDKTIVDISREFLNSNGAVKTANVQIPIKNIEQENKFRKTPLLNENDLEMFIGSLNICSQKGLAGRFDSSIGAAAVTAPYGGKYQLTPVQAMTAKIPVLKGETKTCSIMSWGFDPEVSSVSPYHGAIDAVVHSIAKIIATGGRRNKCWLSFQEYFEKLRDDPLRWGKPAASLLGALDAQIGLETAAIGGKDSMSGSYKLSDGTEIDVPPTLVSFAVSVSKNDKIISPEFKKPCSFVYFFEAPFAVNEKPDFKKLIDYFDSIENLIDQGIIVSAWAAGSGGTADAVFKMCLGNRIGFESKNDLFSGSGFCGFIAETNMPVDSCAMKQKISFNLLGHTTEEYILKTPSINISLEKLQAVWEQTLEPVYPCLIKQNNKTENFYYDQNMQKNESSSPVSQLGSTVKKTKPVFLLPVFPGTNGEYDSIRAIEKAGGTAQVFIIKNKTAVETTESIINFGKVIDNSQVIFIPGGSSGGDEPDGCAKFIAIFFRNKPVSNAVMELLQKRNGLICGIGNGFQALVKLGLVPYGEIRDMTEESPSFAFNTIGRHQCTLVNTKIVSNNSPWLSHLKQGDQYIVPVSHMEGRFAASESAVRKLASNGQIATQYADFDGNASQDIFFNPGNSDFSVEGLTSADGRIFAKMAHNERFDDGLFKNIPGICKMDIFTGAVKYFG